MTSVKPKPKGAQLIIESLRKRIVSDQWKPGEKISSEYSLSHEFGVCRATVTKALKELEREGLLVGKQGKGRFVADLSTRPRTWAIGVVLSNLDALTHPVLAQVIHGMRDAILDSDYHLKLTAFNAASNQRAINRVDDWLDLLDPSSIDGAIIATREVQDHLIEALTRYVPLVRVQGDPVGPRSVSVTYDFETPACAAVEHLLSLGHQRIGVVTIPEQFMQGRDQVAGAKRAVKNAGLKVDDVLEVFVTQRNRAPYGYAATLEVLQKKIRPTALLCGSDDLLLGVYQAAEELGMHVPRDLSLVGWNDALTTDDVPVALTSVKIDHYQIGNESMNCLMELMKSSDIERATRNLPAELVIRNSTATPAG